MRSCISSVALTISLVCFSVGLALQVGAVHGSNPTSWKDVGWIGIVVALLCGSRP